MTDLSNENVIHIKKNGIEFLQFRKLLEYSNVIKHAYSIGIDRNFMIDDASNKVTHKQIEIAMQNYIDLTTAIESDYIHLVKPQQMHSKEIKCVEKKENYNSPDFKLSTLRNTDGLITNKPNILLTTTNADCILLLFFDPVKKIIANTHSGWRGTLQRISVETVKKMQIEYGSNPKDIICCMCPSIRKCHFEVQNDVKEKFESEFKEIQDFISETVPNTKWNIDTIFINKELLKNAGLKAENIIDSGICSVCHSDFIHSFRAEGKKYGLSTAIIEIKS